MNRQQRRAAAKQGTPEAQDPPTTNQQGSPKPGFGLKLLSRLLLSEWVLKRVHHPDVLGILLQVAQQVGRTDVVVRLTTMLHSLRR